jgi:hypothetical protein
MIVKFTGELLINNDLLGGLNLLLRLALPVECSDLIVNEGYLFEVSRV